MGLGNNDTEEVTEKLAASATKQNLHLCSVATRKEMAGCDLCVRYATQSTVQPIVIRFQSAGIYGSLSRREVCDDDLYEPDSSYGDLIRSV